LPAGLDKPVALGDGIGDNKLSIPLDYFSTFSYLIKIDWHMVCSFHWRLCSLRLLCVAAAMCMTAICSNEGAGQEAKGATAPGTESLPEVVARWDFGTEDTNNFVMHGSVQRDQPGPRPPQYPDFEANNTSLRLPGDGSHLKIGDPGKASLYDFAQGDAITLEAWVKVTDLEMHEHHVIIGKGRTGNKGFPSDNQNWALRIRNQGGKGQLNFLFATDPKESKGGHWHRWTSKEGFEASSGWHHVAIAYRFGEPDSIRGWLDGKRVNGSWDMGGPTSLAPIVDDDEVWIGASQGGLPANSFGGYIDAVVIHRGLVSDDAMKGRYRREGPAMLAVPEVMPDVGPIPRGIVLLTLHEKLKSHQRWLVEDESMPESSLQYDSLGAFFLQRLPVAWEAWGIRDHWGVPVVARLAADVNLPVGNHKLLLRTRGLSRLWINGQVVARTQPLTGSPSGEEPITPLPVPLRNGIRLPGYRQQEAVVDWTVSQPGVSRVVLETIVGGKGHRPDTGELVVAIELEGTNQFRLLSCEPIDGTLVPLTDSAIEPHAKQGEEAMRRFDIARRRTLAESQDAYWSTRHADAKEFASKKLAALIRRLGVNSLTDLSIDGFIQKQVEEAKLVSQNANVDQATAFQETIGSILQEHCVRCHGQRSLGGFQLNDKESLLLGGNSGLPGVTPGQLDESELWRRITTSDVVERMPPHSDGLTSEHIAAIKNWIEKGAEWPATALSVDRLTSSPLLDDTSFLRKVTLDTIGTPPTEPELRAFLADQSADKRSQAIERLLADKRWADHWLPYWQDVLAENPTLINASLNSTGPFRWFLHDALYDDKPLDRWVTELIMMRGNPHTGGSAGFGIAAENDAPYATKAQILAGAFLGVELQCARCHDSPYHSTTQEDLFALASMLERKSGTVPKTSRVPAAFFEKQQRAALIKATLKPDAVVEPSWPFEDLLAADWIKDDTLSQQVKDDSRAQLAYLLTGAQNERFAQVVVNRIWRRLIGVGIVEPPHDWEGNRPSHPELLEWLAWEFVHSGYNVKHVERMILNSQLYQRVSQPKFNDDKPATRLFTAPVERRMTAEQVLDSMITASGSVLDVEELTFDPDGRRAADNRISLGVPTRAWMFPSLANERDRPSLNLPKAQAAVTVLESFGWIGARQSPRTDREADPNVLQPGVLANGTLSTWVTRASFESELSQLAMESKSPEQLVESLYLRFLSRLPQPKEAERFVAVLKIGFEQRVLASEKQVPIAELEPLRKVTWSNHLMPEATTIMMELERRARLGPSADPRFDPKWREAYEDVVWCLLNMTEFVWLP
jgi:mono/diheme cytochrome c family protein